MSVETKKRMLGFDFFFYMVFWGFSVPFFSFYKPLSGLLTALQQWVFLMLLVEQLLAQAAETSPVFQERSTVRLLLLGKGMGFCCATLPGGSGSGRIGCWS